MRIFSAIALIAGTVLYLYGLRLDAEQRFKADAVQTMFVCEQDAKCSAALRICRESLNAPSAPASIESFERCQAELAAFWPLPAGPARQ